VSGGPAKGVRVVAALEAAKGVVVLLAGIGAFALLHRDIQGFAEELVSQFHLNPANRYPRIFLEAMAKVSDARLNMLAGLAFVYASVRFIEAYGLWLRKRWAEWFAALAGAVYIPIEIFEITRGASWAKFSLLALNVSIVAYLAFVLWKGRARR
jgi:uncharacterized membrane protein (DUF2068 family)